MEMFQWLMVVLTLSVSRVAVVHGGRCAPPYEECFCVSDSITCSNRGWTTLPKITDDNQIFGPLESFDISDNNISAIPADSIPKSVQLLDISRNPISVIDPTAFEGSKTTLNFIFMSDVKFTKLPDAFLGLQNLTIFFLQDSAVEDWNPPVFNNFASTLDTLELQHAGLKSWPSWLNNLTKLSTVSLASEFIHTIPDDAFDALADTLLSLTINFSNLTHVPKALGILRNLQEIYLDFCSFQDLNGIPRTESLSLGYTGLGDGADLLGALKDIADYLSYLFLRGNELTVIPDFSKLPKLRRVDLSHNKISDATDGSFPNSVQVVKMYSNRLVKIPTAVAHKPNLEELYLSKNAISQISSADTPKQLLKLDLSSNNISELTSDSFPIDSQMTRLDLQTNPLNTISPAAFENLKQLERLDLSNTSLTGIPLALASLEKLEKLKYIDSPSCPCPVPEELMSWFARRQNQIRVYGTCGGVDMRTYLRGATCRTNPDTVTKAPTPDTTEDDSNPGGSGHQIYSVGSLCVCLLIILLIGR